VSWAIVSPERLKLIAVSDGRLELYDLNEDPAETHNLAGQRPQESGQLLRELEAWKERYPLTQASQRPKNPHTLDRLRALGYVR
jgi:hypothetical protein